MDAVKFLEEYKRMCDSSDSCDSCSADGQCIGYGTNNAAGIVAITKKWSKEHSRKTRQSAFLEQWPNAELDSNGVIVIDPCDINKTIYREDNGCYNNNCDDCRREFWTQEVE